MDHAATSSKYDANSLKSISTREEKSNRGGTVIQVCIFALGPNRINEFILKLKDGFATGFMQCLKQGLWFHRQRRH